MSLLFPSVLSWLHFKNLAALSPRPVLRNLAPDLPMVLRRAIKPNWMGAEFQSCLEILKSTFSNQTKHIGMSLALGSQGASWKESTSQHEVGRPCSLGPPADSPLPLEPLWFPRFGASACLCTVVASAFSLPGCQIPAQISPSPGWDFTDSPAGCRHPPRLLLWYLIISLCHTETPFSFPPKGEWSLEITGNVLVSGAAWPSTQGRSTNIYWQAEFPVVGAAIIDLISHATVLQMCDIASWCLEIHLSENLQVILKYITGRWNNLSSQKIQWGELGYDQERPTHTPSYGVMMWDG